MLCLGQQDWKVAFENVPHRLPINAPGFHGHVLDSQLLPPHDQLSKLAGRTCEAANVLPRFAGLRKSNTSSDAGLVHIQSAAPRVHHFHGRLLPPCHVWLHKSRTSPSRALLRREGDRPLFSTASRVKLIPGLLGSTQANDHIRPRLRQPNSFSSAVVPEGHVELIPSDSVNHAYVFAGRNGSVRGTRQRDSGNLGVRYRKLFLSLGLSDFKNSSSAKPRGLKTPSDSDATTFSGEAGNEQPQPNLA